MNPKCVVLDLDDVIFNFLDFLIDIHNKLNGTRLSPCCLTAWNFDGLEIKDISGKVVYGHEIRKTMNDYINEGMLAALEPVTFAQTSVDICQELGYKVIFLTARSLEQKKQTMISLLKHNLKHDLVVFQKNKSWALNEISKLYEIEVYVDDNDQYIREMQNSKIINQIFLMNKPHNMTADIGDRVSRINNLMEVVSQLRSLK